MRSRVKSIGRLALAVLLLFGLQPAGLRAEHDQDAEIAYTVTPERAKLFLEVGERPIFIDLRPAKDFTKGRLPKARSIPISDLQKRFAEVPRSGRVILYCDCPVKEIDAAYSFLEDRGYRNVSVMEGGFSGWVRRKFPVDR